MKTTAKIVRTRFTFKAGNHRVICKFPIPLEKDSDGELNCWTRIAMQCPEVIKTLETEGINLNDNEAENLRIFFKSLFVQEIRDALSAFWTSYNNTNVLVNLDTGCLKVIPLDDDEKDEDVDDDEWEDDENEYDDDEDWDDDDEEWNDDDDDEECHVPADALIDKVIYSKNCTIIIFIDGSKSRSWCDEEDAFSPVAGFAIALCKSMIGNSEFHDLIEKYCRPEYDKRKQKESEKDNK